MESYGEDTQEWGEAKLRYGKIRENLGKQISLGIGFVGLSERLKDWEEDRGIMQDTRGSRKEEVNMALPPITGEAGNEEKESAISEKGDPNLGDRDLVRNHLKQYMIRKKKPKTRFRKKRKLAKR